LKPEAATKILFSALIDRNQKNVFSLRQRPCNEMGLRLNVAKRSVLTFGDEGRRKSPAIAHLGDGFRLSTSTKPTGAAGAHAIKSIATNTS
jgi:hypothetical protein